MKVLVVGAGFSGATIAQQHCERGDDVIVIDRRDHIAGNAFTEHVDGQLVHVYGPHIFHSKNEETWRYINRFCKMQRYTHQVRAIGQDGKHYSLPFSLLTFNQVLGATSPLEARKFIDHETSKFVGDVDTVEGWCLKNVGHTLYHNLIEAYTSKMWGVHPSRLPSSLIKRLPLRLHDSNADYFDDPFQGIPEKGYADVVDNMLVGCTIKLRTSCDPETFSSYDRIYYTGRLDELNGFELGVLNARALRFDRFVGESQGCAQLNDCSEKIKHTRTSESWLIGKHPKPQKIWLVRETPDPDGEPAYPVNDDHNNFLQSRYVELCKSKWPNLVPAGRMATWRYLDMDQAIGQALNLIRKAPSSQK